MKTWYFLCVIALVNANNFNPFADEDLFSINWAGSIDIDALKKEQGDLEIVSVQTNDNEKYYCVIPESLSAGDSAAKAAYNGPTPEELMEALFSQSACSYRIESYWTYELCHGKHLRQYHEDKELGLKKAELKEYYLGKLIIKPDTTKDAKTKSQGSEAEDNDEQKDEETPKKEGQQILSIKLDGLDLPYFSVNMSDGSTCDVTGKPRASHIMYVCQPTGRGEIYQLKETSSCEYNVIVLTAALCSHPSFKPKDPPVNKINCHASGSSPTLPNRLRKLNEERGIKMDSAPVAEGQFEAPPLPVKQQTTSRPPVVKPPVNTAIGKQADKELLRDFLNGDYCIHGVSQNHLQEIGDVNAGDFNDDTPEGGGWWKHEYCHNKHAKQYHEEPNSLTSIYLGHWDKQKHLDWLAKNPSKRPKPVGSRKHVSLFYFGGDVCDVTGLPRLVEVKLKCLERPGQPHAVSIYLVEPSPCEYVLGVESPILCDVLDEADDNGIMDHIKVSP